MKKYANKVFTPVILLMLVIFAAIMFLSFRKTAAAKAAAAMVAHSQEVLFETANILSFVTDNETGSRGFVITGQQVYLEPVIKSKVNVYQKIETLRQLTADNAEQQLRIDSLLLYTKKRLSFSDSTILLRKEKGFEPAAAFTSTGRGKQYMDAIRLTMENMQQAELRLLQKRRTEQEKAGYILNRSIISIVIVFVVLTLILLRKDYLAISARRIAEEALRKNENFFQLMTNSVKDYAIFLLDANGSVISWNKGAERVTGYEKQDILGQPFTIFFTPKDKDNDEPRRNLALAKKYGQFQIEGLRLRKDGSSFWACVVIIALVNEQGHFHGYSIITQDITERKGTQEELEILSRQINQSNDAIFTVDADRKIKSWNRGAENLYGYKKFEVLEKSSNEVLKTDLTEDEIEQALHTIAKKDYWSGELKRQTKNGSVIYVHSSTTTIKDNRGNITGYVAVSFDVTGQKKLRGQINHLASLVEQSAEAIISAGLDERIISWNGGAEQLYGFSKKEAIGKTPAALGLTKLTGNRFSGVIKDITEHGHWKAETGFMHKNGSVFFGAITANIIKNEQGETSAVVFIIKDITPRRKLEKQLKHSNEELERRVNERTEKILKNEQRFRALIENSAEGIALTDKKGHIFYRSPAAYKIAGALPMGDTKGITHPDDVEMIKNKHLEVLEKPDEPVPFQARFQHPDGHYFWLEGTFTNLLHKEGINAIVANYRDVSQRKRTEEKLIASEKHFRRTLDNMLEGVQIIGFDWRYLYVNDAVTVHGKYSREELIGHTMMEKYPGIDQTEMFRMCRRCFSERISFQLENKFVYPDDTVAWFELSLQPVPEGVFILSVDITGRKKAEERLIKSEKLYRNLFENMLHGFAYCRGIFENGRLTDYIHLGINKEFEIATGLKDVAWKKLSDLMPGLLQSKPAYADLIGRVALDGVAEKLEVYAEPLKKWLSVSLYSPEKEYFVILVDNITERKQTEHKIKKLNADLEKRVMWRTEQLRKTNEELEAFSYSVSHDLRAPLRAIIGFTAILEDEYCSKLDSEAKRITAIIKNNTLKMGHLIDDLLMFSRMGRQDIIKTHIDTNNMVTEIIEQTDSKQYNPNPIDWVIHPLAPINGDANTIRQVWINLVSNAVKYSGKASNPKIEIGSYKDNGKIVFFVKDNGVGFDEKYKNKLFRVFQRLHNADEFEGTGIGLAIVEKIVSRHDGVVWADAAVDKGASFYISFPDVA